MRDLDDLVSRTIPADIRLDRPLDLPPARSEREVLADLARKAGQNEVWRSYLGLGYHNTVTPPVILRNVLENPGWYTAYTPYQAEISQGRLEALLLFQTLVEDLTGLSIANASLLDEGTAAAEAMAMCHRIKKGKRAVFLVSDDVHPQTLDVLRTRAEPLSIEVRVQNHADFVPDETVFGVLLQYPATDGSVHDHADLADRVHAAGGLVCVATDLLALCVLEEPAAFGADVAVGNSQRFGVPLGYGGPHAAFMATHDKFKRQIPGRVIGVSVDAHGKRALRMALQTREQHIRRQKATSNICTAQVLLAVVAAMYAVYHGPEGLTAIARRVHGYATRLAHALREGGLAVPTQSFFDTFTVGVTDIEGVLERAASRRINLRVLDGRVVVALDETVTDADYRDLLAVFGVADAGPAWPSLGRKRESGFLDNPCFHRVRSETEMLRYLHALQTKDLALDTSMIPLGSCTMKLNATVEMMPVTWPGFGSIHPAAPVDQTAGYAELFGELERWLAEITGFDAVSLQPNAGSQGEYAGLLAIRGFHAARGEANRDLCLIPTSAHGTNPASAVMAGMEVVPVACDERGNIDVADLRAKAGQHADRLGALMITYPSTHGVFEASIREICDIVHQAGGQVYMDGANMNAMVGLCRPGDFGADVCHLNLHKTFCIPHGGGGPGVGPIGVKRHLAPHLPTDGQDGRSGGAVSAAPYGSASILPISWAYIALLGPAELKRASEVAILNANYIAKRLEGHYDVLYRGDGGFVAHECILDTRGFKDCGVQVDDLAKRLMDYGFHAPTMSFPVVGTLMVEPTESESQPELDRFCDAMIGIRDEIRAIEGGADVERSALRNAPHPAHVLLADDWDRDYTRAQAAYPAPWLLEHKYWPTVSRIDNAAGDRNLICSCPVDWYEQG